MDLRSLRHLVAVADARNLTAAARALHMTQPALSRAIVALETELGYTLFERTRNGMTPTPAAERLLVRSRQLIADFERFTADATGGRGSIGGELVVSLTLPDGFAVATHAVAAVLAAYPDLAVRTVPQQGEREAFDAVASGRSDVAVVGAEVPPAGAGVRAERIGIEEIVVLMPMDSPLAARESLAPAELARHPFVAEPSGRVREILDRWVHSFGVRIAAVIPQRQSVAPIVERGGGLALATRAVCAFAEYGRLAARPLDPPLTVPLWLITREPTTVAVRAFAAEARRQAGSDRPENPL